MISSNNVLRLRPLHLSELPHHSLLNSEVDAGSSDPASADTSNSTDSSRPLLPRLVGHVLATAYEFAQDEVPRTFHSKGTKKSPPSTGEVDVLAHAYSDAEVQGVNWQHPDLPRERSGKGVSLGEQWFARRSRHANQSEDGTSTFSELDYGTRQDHPEREMAYTPDVYECFKVLDYDEEIRKLLGEARSVSGAFGEFVDVQMSVREMCHRLPFPCSPRTFAVLVLAARGPKEHSFVVAQIPVDLSTFAASKYSNDRNTQVGETKLKRGKTIKGIYTSVEIGQILPDQTVEWIMATTSDAKGWLPLILQRLGIPGAIVKDVGLLMKWVAGEREKRRKEGRSLSQVMRESEG